MHNLQLKNIAMIWMRDFLIACNTDNHAWGTKLVKELNEHAELLAYMQSVYPEMFSMSNIKASLLSEADAN